MDEHDTPLDIRVAPRAFPPNFWYWHHHCECFFLSFMDAHFTPFHLQYFSWVGILYWICVYVIVFHSVLCPAREEQVGQISYVKIGVNHRYTLFLSQHGAQIGGLPARNQNNRGSSGAYVTCIYCSLSVKINMPKTPHGAQRSWTHLYCVCFCVCGRQKPEDSQCEPRGWQRYYTGRYRRSGISCIYLWCQPRNIEK